MKSYLTLVIKVGFVACYFEDSSNKDPCLPFPFYQPHSHWKELICFGTLPKSPLPRMLSPLLEQELSGKVPFLRHCCYNIQPDLDFSLVEKSCVQVIIKNKCNQLQQLILELPKAAIQLGTNKKLAKNFDRKIQGLMQT